MISLIIAFVFAFVFRGFVIEAFVIPTGSMAPTLLGKHVRFESPETGASWSVDPWEKSPSQIPLPVQGQRSPMTVSDPMSAARVGQELSGELGRNRRLLSGDRIFVLKYLYSIFDPARFDVVVFKYPGQTATVATAGEQENYIKRLLGLPGEEIALVDGDVFHRPAASPAAGGLAYSDWSNSGWRIARKSERVQRELWQTVYDSRFAPLEPERNLRPWFNVPWRGVAPGGETDPAWRIWDNRSYTFEGTGQTTLEWDSEIWPLDDRYSYNEVPALPTRGPLPPGGVHRRVFPVADLRLALAIEPQSDAVRAAAVVEARGHEFRAEIESDRITLSMRSTAGPEGGEAVELLTTEMPAPLRAGEIRNVEFWHVDQSLQVWVEGELVADATYGWSPALRIAHATGTGGDDLLAAAARDNPLADPSVYLAPRARWEFEGGPFTLHRVRIARDIYYQPGVYGGGPTGSHTRQGQASLGTHPTQPCVLGPDHFFVGGDNSPNSADGRLWDSPDPWVYADIDPTMGVVHRDLLIGKAFFVYFPSIHKERRIPVPDVGRMRFIW